MRLIDADEMIKNLKAMKISYDAIELDGMIKGLEESKTVDAEPVRHGRWIQDDEDAWQCSACGVLWTFIDGDPEDNGAKRCPVCGAKMDGGTE